MVHPTTAEALSKHHFLRLVGVTADGIESEHGLATHRRRGSNVEEFRRATCLIYSMHEALASRDAVAFYAASNDRARQSSQGGGRVRYHAPPLTSVPEGGATNGQNGRPCQLTQNIKLVPLGNFFTSNQYFGELDA